MESLSLIITLVVLAVSSILFVSGKIRSDLVALCALLVLMVTGVLAPTEALAGFSSPVLVMMIGLFVVGGGIFQTGLAKMASSRLLLLAGTHDTRLLVTVMLATSLIGAFISNTGTVAVMMPIVISMARAANVHPGQLLMPLAFSGSLGGMLTLIGTPPNLVIQDALVSAGYEALGFFSFTPVGIAVIATGLVGMLVLRRLLPRRTGGDDGLDRNAGTLQKLAEKYQLAQNLFRVRVSRGSPLIGHKLKELDIPGRHNVGIIEIRRRESARDFFLKTIHQEIAGPGTVVEEGDVLYVNGPFERVNAFAEAEGLTLLDHRDTEDHFPVPSYATEQVGIAEVMVAPESGLIGKAVRESGFREHYRLNVLGIRRKETILLQNLADTKMRLGDVLLLQGEWANIARLAGNQGDVVVIGQPLEEARKVTMDRKAPIAAGIMLLMIVLLVTEWVPAVAAVLLAAVLMVAFRCVRSMEEAYRTINWESIVLIGAMIPVSTAVEKTGAAALLSDALVGSLGGFGPLALLAGVYFATNLLTLFISNTACAVLLAPIALAAAQQAGASPYPFLFAVTVGASMCFASPFSTPPNALVMSAGRYNFGHYLKVGLPLQLLMGIVMIIVLPLLFPF
jgi:di/tricarboxylate transporter